MTGKTTIIEAVGVFVVCAIIAALFFGCAASPDTLIYVEKNVYIYDNEEEVDFFQEANSEVTSDAKLKGTVSPTTDVTVTPGF